MCYALIGAMLIAMYTYKDDGNSSAYIPSFRLVYAVRYYRICAVILGIVSFATLLWLGMSATYVILMLLLLLGLIDIRCLALPDILNFSLLSICIIYAFLDSVMINNGFIERMLLGFGVGGVFFTLKILYQSLSGKDIIGEADIILLSALSIAFGAELAFVSVFIGSVAALVWAIFLAFFSHKSITTLKLPFCFFVFLGTMSYMLWLSYFGDINA